MLSSRRAICSGGVIALILCGAAVIVVVFGSTIWERLGGNTDDLPPYFHDGWGDGGGNAPNGTDLGEFSQWRNNNKGLTLQIQNALTSDWHEFFVAAIQDWNQSPSLSLSTTDVTVPTSAVCQQQTGVMKVCNNFYGKLGWSGLNEIYFSGTKIVMSVAKMNESYLNGAGNAERQYVMCHELGHGFGLPHRVSSRVDAM